MEAEIELRLAFVVFVFLAFVLVFFAFMLMVMAVAVAVFLSAVLLIAHDGVQPALAQMNRVVPHEFVVVNLLMRLGLGVCLQTDILIVFEFARRGIALARDDARREVEIRKFQVRMSPVPVFPEQRRESAFVELRAWDVAVHLILIRVRELLGVAQVPNRAALVAREVERIVEKSVVRLVFGLHIGAHRALR